MENNSTSINLSLEQYNKKYKNRRHRLIKYSKKDVEEFDKKYGFSSSNNIDNHFLLKNRKWALIGDFYYEIPKAPRFTWFRNLNAGVQALTSVLLAGGVVSAVTFPTLNALGIFSESSSSIDVVIESSSSDMGSVSGLSGKHKIGESITVVATPKDKYGFSGWYDNNKYEGEPLSTNASYTFTLKRDTKLYAKFTTIDFATCDWRYISNACNALEVDPNDQTKLNEFYSKFLIDGNKPTALNDFVGKEKTTVVNGQTHKIRVIDTLHDVDENDNKLAFTFEFENLISDEDGNSLSYLWYDYNVMPYNEDYLNSSIRYALTGSGNNVNHGTQILVAKKGGVEWSSSPQYRDKKIIDMIPQDLTSLLKSVKKTVRTTSSWTITPYTDKLFLPSGLELGGSDSRGCGTKYYFYNSESAESRIKKQVNNTVEYTNTSIIPKGKEHSTNIDVENYAGYNFKTDTTGGGIYYTSSPGSYSGQAAVAVYRTGYIDNSIKANQIALPVAPAFCI